MEANGIGGRKHETEIIVALISGLVGTLAGSFVGYDCLNKLTNYRIKQLENKVAEHNNYAHRMPVVRGTNQGHQPSDRRLGKTRSREEDYQMKANWKNWLKAAGVRAVKTVAETALQQLEQLP